MRSSDCNCEYRAVSVAKLPEFQMLHFGLEAVFLQVDVRLGRVRIFV